jgi:SAM-dependent methyltransferase
MRALQAKGFQCLGVDRDPAALQAASAFGSVLQADLEHQAWPLHGRTFGAVVVTNYLWRSLLPAVVGSVAPGGVLIYETFAAGNETVGKPSNPELPAPAR